MGSGVSTEQIPDTLDKESAEQLAGDKWDAAKWEAAAVDGSCTKDQFLQAGFPSGGSSEDAAPTPRTEGSAVTKIQARFRGKIARNTMWVAGFAIRAANRFDYYKKLGITEEELTTIKACFGRYNVDNDNSISSNELRAAIHDMEDPNDPVDPHGTEFATLFKNIDQNGNDEIELGEFCRWWVSGSDDMDSNFMKWWFKHRWGELCKDPDFLKSEVRQFVPPEVVNADGMDAEIEGAYAQNADVDISEIKDRIFPLDTVYDVPIVPGELTMTYAALSQRGYYPESLDKANQDAYTVQTPFRDQPDEHFFGVFDGHGQHGDYVSGYVRDNAPTNIAAALGSIDLSDAEAIKKTISDAVVFTDARMHCSKDRMSGTTLVSAYIKGKECYVANVGDSRAVVGKKGDGEGLYAVALTHDQTPYRRDERDRCRKTGCRVMNMDQLEGYEEMHDNWDIELGEEIDDGGDPPRIWHKTKNLPGCAFTRSLGDQVAIPWGVVSEPEMSSISLTPQDKMLIVASDGVWEFITNQGAVNMCQKYKDPLDACRHVVAEAYKMWMIHDTRTDDITIILVEFNWEGDGRAIVQNTTGGFRHKGVSKDKQKQIDSSGISFDDSVPFELENHTCEKSEEVSGEIRAALAGNALFNHLPVEANDQAIACFEQIEAAEGDILIKQGDAGKYYFVAKSGEYDVLLKDALVSSPGLGPCVHTYTCTESLPSFGELSLLHPQPCAASVVCKKPGTIWRIACTPFRSIVAAPVADERRKSQS